ncbi:hypothetical protein LOD99_12270 [Oopsacas minuta]|uniref:Uncharacterized protein n=1 Tax=Oopsacas minuta TaxID=111878 RepID=A0AAV7JF50_9METZ|nr:hypothetical protein LOD99_12270 [Oopsacas minuta]
MATSDVNNNNPSPHLGTSLLHAIRPTFQMFAKGKFLFKAELIKAFRALQLEVTLSELDQLLAGACIAARRVEADYLTCGEFALSAVEFVKFKRVQKQSVESRLSSLQHSEADNTGDGNHYSVFLGGSCNPTTWRVETAIPYFEKVKVSYYNPQVDNWYPELIQIEEEAKRNSTIKLFVFDSETRALASLVETAFMASIGWRLVVVLHYLSESDEVKIAGETLTKQEVKDLNRGRSFLCDILEKSGIPVFDNLEEALKLTSDLVQGRDSYERILQAKKCTTHHYGTWLIEIREIFDKFSTLNVNRRSINDTPGFDRRSLLSAKRLSVPDILDMDVQRSKLQTNKPVPSLSPNAAISALELFLETRSLNSSIQKGLSFLDLVGLPIDYEVFCQFTAEAAYQHYNSIWIWSSSIMTNFFRHTYSLLKNALNQSLDLTSDPEPLQEEDKSSEYDVFLGGTCANTTWREEIGIPLLKANKISYYNPQLPQEEWSVRKMADEHLAKQTSKVLIFMISKISPSIASMTEAAYMMTSSKAVFLTIEDINLEDDNFAYPLTKTACKDYNRGRAYLKKTAEIFNIPVSHNIEETLDSIVKHFQVETPVSS